MRGAFCAACLAEMQQKRLSLATADNIAGVSVGCLIGAIIATNSNMTPVLTTLQDADVAEHHSTLVNLFHSMQVYKGHRESMFSTKSLKDFVTQFVGLRPVKCKQFTAVAGKAKELEQYGFVFDRNQFIDVEALMASCAIVGAYPAVQLLDENNKQTRFIDGGFSHAFPMEFVHNFMENNSAKTLTLFAAKPWMGKIPDLELDNYSVKNMSLRLFRRYWYSLTKLDHMRLFDVLKVPHEMVEDGCFAAVLKFQNGTWDFHSTVNVNTTNFSMPSEPTKVIFFCAPLGKHYLQYESMNLAQHPEERLPSFLYSVKKGRNACSVMHKLYKTIFPLQQAKNDSGLSGLIF